MLVCAAIKVIPNNESREIIVHGVRHADCFFIVKRLNMHDYTVVEGFCDDEGKFYDRFEAFEYALNNHQMSQSTKWYKEDHGEKQLFSEDLY